MKVKLSELPREVQLKIPMSIRSASDTYEISQLPPKEQELVREYLSADISLSYGTTYDLIPQVSKFGDLYATSSIKETVTEYLKNYFYTLPSSYPFDPAFGCRLKYHLQSRDTQLRKLLIAEEVNNVVGALTSDLGLNIQINEINISPISTSMSTSFNITINISIPGEEHIVLNIENLNNE